MAVLGASDARYGFRCLRGAAGRRAVDDAMGWGTALAFRHAALRGAVLLAPAAGGADPVVGLTLPHGLLVAFARPGFCAGDFRAVSLVFFISAQRRQFQCGLE